MTRGRDLAGGPRDVVGCIKVGKLLSNRSLMSSLGLACCLGALASASIAQTQTAAGQTASSASAPIPVCGLEGEIGEGRGRIVALGAGVGYRGELSIPLAQGPETTLTVASEFAPHKPAVDRIALVIGPEALPNEGGRLAGAFGALDGGRFPVGRQGEVPDMQRAWFDELMSGGTLTASMWPDSAPVTYPARQFEADYNYLLDLLQLVANWEVAGKCVNRAAD